MDRKEMERLRDHLTAVLEHNDQVMVRRADADPNQTPSSASQSTPC